MNRPDLEKKVCKLLDKKLGLFERYVAITQQLKDALKNNEREGSRVFISQRQACIKKIEMLDALVMNIVGQQTEHGSRLSGKLKDAIEQFRDKIIKAVEEVSGMDHEMMAMLIEGRESLKAELLKMNTFREAARGYGSGRETISRFVNATR